MNTKNLEYLKESLKYLGFDTKLNEQLEQKISAGEPEFKLNLSTSFNQQPIEATLYFRGSGQEEMYFFNKYDAAIKDNQDQFRAQTFYIHKGSGVTLKEASNLLNGRSVHKTLFNKEGEKYQAWMQLDFNQKDDRDNYQVKQYHTNYGYNLESAVGKYPVKEMGDERFRGELLKSLQKGNLQGVTFVRDGKEERMFIEANPQYKSINVYGNDMKQVREERQQQGQEVPSQKSGEHLKSGKDTQKPGEQNNNELVKKRTSERKGMRM